MFAFGQGAFGALGLGDTSGHSTPQQITSLSSSGVVGIAAGESSRFAPDQLFPNTITSCGLFIWTSCRRYHMLSSINV